MLKKWFHYNQASKDLANNHNQNLQVLIDKHGKATDDQQKKAVEKDIIKEFNFMRFHIAEGNSYQQQVLGEDNKVDSFFEWHIFHNGNL